MRKYLFLFILVSSQLSGQTSLTVMQGDTIEFRAFEVTTLVDFEKPPGVSPIPSALKEETR